MKAGQLVCQHLENISRDALEKYQDIIRAYVSRREGVYALYRDEELYYVGLAKDLRWRLKAHLKDKHGEGWDRFSVYLTIGDKHLRELEVLLLHVIKPTPEGNTRSGAFVRSENLRRRFMADIRRFHRDELDRMVGEPEKLYAVITGTGRVPALFGRVRKRFQIRGRSKGKQFQAVVRLDGTIRFQGKQYSSPSAAAAAATKYPVDGWMFWKYERAPGDWVRLNELRK